MRALVSMGFFRGRTRRGRADFHLENAGPEALRGEWLIPRFQEARSPKDGRRCSSTPVSARLHRAEQPFGPEPASPQAQRSIDLRGPVDPNLLTSLMISDHMELTGVTAGRWS
jgi:hypothetical protein